MTNDTNAKPWEIARDESERKALDTLRALGFTIEADFVPFSQSGAAATKKGRALFPSLNWRVRVMRNGREIISTPYFAGMGHAPASKLKFAPAGGSLEARKRAEQDKRRAIAWECEHGRAVRNGRMIYTGGSNGSWRPLAIGEAIVPSIVDVMHCITLDAGAIEFASFEEWADNYGENTDSRAAEATYRQCLAYGLALRAAVGEEGLQALRDAFEDM